MHLLLQPLDQLLSAKTGSDPEKFYFLGTVNVSKEEIVVINFGLVPPRETPRQMLRDFFSSLNRWIFPLSFRLKRVIESVWVSKLVLHRMLLLSSKKVKIRGFLKESYEHCYISQPIKTKLS